MADGNEHGGGRVSTPEYAKIAPGDYIDDVNKTMLQHNDKTRVEGYDKISYATVDSNRGKTQRLIQVNKKTYTDPKKDPYCSNSIRTSRYTGLTWAPKSLILQFRRAANIYFLIITILTCMPFSPKNPISMIGTFVAVLIFTMLKEAYEDYFRHKQDNQINNAKTRRINIAGLWDEILWKDVNVGDILMVKDGEQFPADLIFLSSSNKTGLAFVDTMNLDGETNLKEKLAIESTRNMVEKDLSVTYMEFEYDQPNMSLIRWNCNGKFKEDFEWTPMGMNQLMLRGCILKNTDYAYGVVVYTGHETKVMLNGKAAPSKMSNVLLKMNKMLYSVFLFQAFICLTFAGLNMHWQSQNADNHTYLDLESAVGASGYIIQVLTFLVAYSHLIPISLYVALEVVKLVQSYLISHDLEMYYEPDDRAATCRTSDLVEELGQVEFVFSDKTGTLTQNVMEFKQCSIKGEIYHMEKLVLKDLPGISALKTPEVSDFFQFMAICHTVFPNQTDSKIPNYQAASPDELALVQASADLGFIFSEKTNDYMYTDFPDIGNQSWEVLCEIPFNSNRKRMSLIVRDPESHDLILLTKGADSIMLPLLKEADCDAQDHLDGFAREGLRTLVMAKRTLDKDEYTTWSKKWKELQLSNSDDKEEMMENHGATIEHSYHIVGASAIEDKLQDMVPETISLLMAANIRVWVLTGDKQETAIEIGRSCSLLKENMNLIDLSSDTMDSFERKLNEYIKMFELDSHSVMELNKIKGTMKKKQAIVINGPTLAWALDASNGYRENFFKLGFMSDSCICCRVSPAQKMQVVQLAKDHGPWITLSIGDGANDVSMIQEAHIGVGIAGKEGTSALQASDYAFGQFSFLSRLLLIHGRWGYRRICYFICYYFYKNIVVVFTEIWFAIFNGFSGQIYFLEWLPMLYNAFFTSWVCLSVYIFEQDVSAKYSLLYPKVYGPGQKGIYFGFKVFWKWVGLALWHGAICYFLPMYGLSKISGEYGDTGLWWTSTVSFTMIIHVVTYKLFVESVYWNLINIICMVLSFLLYYLTVIVLNTPSMSATFQPQLAHLFFKILGSEMFWIWLVIGPLLAILPDLLIKFYNGIFRATIIDNVMRFATAREKGNNRSIVPIKDSMFGNEND